MNSLIKNRLNPEIETALLRQNEFFSTGKTKNIEFRKEQLKKLQRAIRENEQEIFDALYTDFRKPPFETFETEIGTVLNEIKDALKNIKKWSKPGRAKTPLTHLPAKSRIHNDPYGVALIIAPWNYPFNLLLAPLIGAICAGNCAILMTSFAAPETSSTAKKILNSIFPQDYVAVFEGGVEENGDYLQLKYDYIFFTGGPEVGQIVLESAARHLTPCTLELGGKSPCIVADDADLKIAARRIVWGKFLNCGQTCVAPDYLLVSRKTKGRLLELMIREIKNFYGHDPESSDHFPRIINERHFDRINRLLQKGDIVAGGKTKRAEKYIAPTIIDNVSMNDPVMQEEIFGPLLPVVTIDSVDEAISIIKDRPKPLALYLFTKNRKLKKRILRDTSFGGGCINDTLMHFANSHTPFGGVGMSGMGSCHGEASFRTFSHQKSILEKSNFLDNPFRYPPYSKLGIKILKMFMG